LARGPIDRLFRLLDEAAPTFSAIEALGDLDPDVALGHSACATAVRLVLVRVATKATSR